MVFWLTLGDPGGSLRGLLVASGAGRVPKSVGERFWIISVLFWEGLGSILANLGDNFRRIVSSFCHAEGNAEPILKKC